MKIPFLPRQYHINIPLRSILRLAVGFAFILYIASLFGRIKIPWSPFPYSSSLLRTFGSPNNDDDGSIREVYQFPEGTWISDIAVRSNGQLLVTLNSAPEIWNFDPVVGTARLVRRFDHVTAVFGVAKIGDDVFAVATGNWSVDGLGIPGTVRTSPLTSLKP